MTDPIPEPHRSDHPVRRSDAETVSDQPHTDRGTEVATGAPTPAPDRPANSTAHPSPNDSEDTENGVSPIEGGSVGSPIRSNRWRRRLGWAALVVGLLAVAPLSSLLGALRAPGNLTLSEKSAEWMRDHGLGSVVNHVENWWFTQHAPKTGGEPDRAIDTVPPTGAPLSGNPGSSGTSRPPDIVSPAPIPLPNEGVWQAVGSSTSTPTGLYTTQVRPDATHTSLLVGLAWMDPKSVRFEVHPGRQEPGGTWGPPSQVPPEQRLDLLAAFNGGFRMNDANGGFYLDGIERRSLRPGAASFVVTADGRATVGEWGRDVSMGPEVVAVRQNLRLIVDGGQPVDGLDNNTNGSWGDTLGNRVLVWRSGVCVDRNGALIYAYGNGLGARSLAELLQRAGCDRAMELDINPSWTTFNLYSAATTGDPSSVHGTKLLPDQQKGGDRYLSDDARDFVAVLTRRP